MNAQPFSDPNSRTMTPTAPAPFGGNQQDYGVSGDAFSVIFGTAAEEFTHQTTLGAYNPDIINQEMEALHPLATTIGKITGGIVGFGVSMYYLGAIGKVALGSLSFGRAILAGKGVAAGSALFKVGGRLGATATMAGAAGEVMGAGAKASLFRGGVGAFKTGALFSFHDVAEEFISQTKEKDPDVYELGIAATGGFLTGAAFGFVQKAFDISHPIKQIVAGGSAFTVAEAINKKADGEDFDIATDGIQAFLTGALFSAISSRGWKERRGALEEAGIENLKKHIQSYTDDPHAKKIVAEVFELGLFGKGGKATTPTQVFKNIAQKFEPASEKVLKQDFYKAGVGWKEQRTEFKTYSDLVEFVRSIKGSEFRVKDIVKEKYGKTSSAQLTVGEGREMVAYLQDISREIVMGDFAQVVNSAKGYTGFDKSVRPIDEASTRAGYISLLDNMISASRMKSVEEFGFRNSVNTNIDIFYRGSKLTAGEKYTAIKTNVPHRGSQDLIKLMELADKPKEFAAAAAEMGLTKEQGKAAASIREMTMFMWERMNQAREALGLEPVAYRTNYFPHIVKANLDKNLKAPAPGEIGLTKGEPMRGVPTPKEKMITPESPLAKKRELDKPLLELSSKDYEMDARKALNAMISKDMKTIWLQDPVEIFKNRLQIMQKSKEGMSFAKVDDMSWFVNTFIANKPTAGGERWNKALYNLIGTGKVGEAVNSVLAKFGREVPNNPLSAVRSFYGLSVSRAYIFARPALALRNMMQSFYVHAYTDTYSLLKAMSTPTDKMPAEYKKFIAQSPSLRVQLLEAEEGWGAQMGRSGDKIAAQMFSRSQDINVNVAAKAAYFQAKEWVNGRNPMYRKNKINWSDADGRKLRADMKTAKNENWHSYMSEGEQGAVQGWMEHVASHTQFIYHATGLPGLYKDPVMGIAFKLQSYPMNYTLKFMADSWKILKTGEVNLGKSGTYKVPTNVRFGLFKHFVGLGVAVAAFEKAGINMRDIVGVSYDPDANTPAHLRLGVFNMRPSPAVGMIGNFFNMWSDDQYTSRKAVKDLLQGTGVMLPGYLAGKDVIKAYKTGERRALVIRKPFEPKGKKAKQPDLFPKTTYHQFKPF